MYIIIINCIIEEALRVCHVSYWTLALPNVILLSEYLSFLWLSQYQADSNFFCILGEWPIFYCLRQILRGNICMLLVEIGPSERHVHA